MLQLHKVILAICTGYVCTLVCHQLPLVGNALTLRTRSITEALSITKVGDTEDFTIPAEIIEEQILEEQTDALEPQDVPEQISATYDSVVVATPVATATAALTTTLSKPEESSKTTTTIAATNPQQTAVQVSETESISTNVETTKVPESDSASTSETTLDAIPIDAQSLFYEMDTWFKAYMDYRTISDTSSAQYALQQEAWTDDQGLRRIGDDYLVAMGTGWLTNGCGDRFLVTLETGIQFTVMVGDIKADCHTDPTRRYRACGGGANVIEFIVDTNLLAEEARNAGTISAYATFAGNIVEIAALE